MQEFPEAVSEPVEVRNLAPNKFPNAFVRPWLAVRNVLHHPRITPDRTQQQPIVPLPRRKLHPRSFKHKKYAPGVRAGSHAVWRLALAASGSRTNFASVIEGIARIVCTTDEPTTPPNPPR